MFVTVLRFKFTIFVNGQIVEPLNCVSLNLQVPVGMESRIELHVFRKES
jgi:hypothetical protein